MQPTARSLTFLLCHFFLAGIAFGEEENPKAAFEYLSLQPNFVVNLNDPRHYLRADVQLLVTDKEHLEKISRAGPALRHALIMLFSSYTPEQLATVEEREQLRAKSLLAVRESLDRYSSSEGLVDLFFTEFLVQ